MARKLIVEIVGDSRSLERSFARSTAASKRFGRDVEHAGRGAVVATGALGGLGRAASFASASFLGGAGAVFALKEAVTAASDLSEEINKSAVVFGEHGQAMQTWSETSATALGLSQQQALAAAGAFGAMFETSGLAEGQAAGMSRTMVKLASDMASFNNEDPGEMLDRLRSGLAGEAEPLRRFGILLSEARVQQEAVRIGLVKAGDELTEQQKVQARYSILLRDTSRQQGDFARTSGGMANQMRILRAQITNTAASIGQTLLPMVLDATKALNKWLEEPENQERIQRAAEKTATGFEKTVRALGHLNRAGQVTEDIMGLLFLKPLEQIPFFHEHLAHIRNDLHGINIELKEIRLPTLDPAKPSDVGFFNPLSGLAEAIRTRGDKGRARATALGADLPFREFQLAMAEATEQRKDDEEVLRVIVAALRQRLGRATPLKAKNEIQQSLNQYQGQLTGLLEQDAQDVRDAADKIRAKRKAAREAARDAARSALDALSDALDNQVSALREQAERIRDAARRRREADIARRSQFETPLRLQLEAARAGVTPGEGDDRAVAAKVADAARKALKSGNLLMEGQIDAWNTLADALRGLDRETGTATTFHKQSVSELTANLGLSLDKRRELAGRLAQRSRTGTVPNEGTGAFGRPIIIHNRTTVELDRQQVATSVTKVQQVRDKRNPRQKRGPHGI